MNNKGYMCNDTFLLASVVLVLLASLLGLYGMVLVQRQTILTKDAEIELLRKQLTAEKP